MTKAPSPDESIASMIGWTHFITQTFRSPRAVRMFPAILAWGRKMGVQADWFARVELGEDNGRMHVHMLARTPYWQSKSGHFVLMAWGKKKFGFATVRRVNADDAAVRYMSSGDSYELSKFSGLSRRWYPTDHAEKLTRMADGRMVTVRQAMNDLGLDAPVWKRATLEKLSKMFEYENACLSRPAPVAYRRS